MRIYTRGSTYPSFFAVVQSDSGSEQSVRSKDTVHRVLVGKHVDEQKLSRIMSHATHEGDVNAEDIARAVDSTSSTVAPLSQAFKDELARQAATFNHRPA